MTTKLNKNFRNIILIQFISDFFLSIPKILYFFALLGENPYENYFQSKSFLTQQL